MNNGGREMKSTLYSNLTISYENISASALSVDVSGVYAVLAGRTGLCVIDLEQPELPSRILHHQSQWDVNVVKCHPHQDYNGYIASTSNHNTLIWNIGSDGSALQPLQCTLRAHSRPVSDISWSPLEPSIVATCSADANTYVWDVRVTKEPIMSLKTLASSTSQVAWSPMTQSSIATAHDGEVRVWDTRYPSKAPVSQITAHMQTIYGIDWNPMRSYELLTCSEDKSVKFWDVMNPRVCQGSILTGAPVWKAKYAPFGQAVVTVANRIDSTIRLWSLSHSEQLAAPQMMLSAQGAIGTTIPALAGKSSVQIEQVHGFVGHDDYISGFGWRKQDDDYQLISCSKKQQLNMWKMENQYLHACGHVRNQQKKSPAHQQDAMHYSENISNNISSKYSLDHLKSDLYPTKGLKNAIPLSHCNVEVNRYYKRILTKGVPKLEHNGNETANALESENTNASCDEDSDSDSSLTANVQHKLPGTMSDTSLPCPRYSGAVFGGANELLYFNSSILLPRSSSTIKNYAMLLQKKKQSRIGKAAFGKYVGRNDLSTKVNAFEHGSPQSLFDYTGNSILFSLQFIMVLLDTAIRHRLLRNLDTSMNFPSPTEGKSGSLEKDASVHGGGYLKEYFASSQHHLAINDPGHVISSNMLSSEGFGAETNLSFRGLNRDRSSKKSIWAYSIPISVLDVSAFCNSNKLLAILYDYGAYSESQRYLLPVAKHLVMPKTSCEQLGSQTMSGVELETMLNRSRPDSTSFHRSSSWSKLSKTKDSGAPNIASNTSSTDDSIRHSTVEVPKQLTSSITESCKRNAGAATSVGAEGTAIVWNVLSAIANSDVLNSKSNNPDDYLHPWAHHPFGRPLVRKLLQLQASEGDVQTLATMASVLRSHQYENEHSTKKSYHTRPVTEHEKIASNIHPVGSESNFFREKFLAQFGNDMKNPSMRRKSISSNDLVRFGNAAKKRAALSLETYAYPITVTIYH